MSTQALYDLTPLANLLLVGASLAIVPLAWVGWRQRHGTPMGRMQALTLFTLFLTFDLVLFGAFTRLTDSGLGCPDWPGCYGHASPIGAGHLIEAAQTAMPTGPVTERKAWIEMIHRYMATGVGALILVIAVMSWQRASRLRWWAAATLVWVCVQGAFGALTVTMKLFPAIVTLHLLGGLVLLALLTVQLAQQSALQWHTMSTGRTASARKMVVTGNVVLSTRISLLMWATCAALLIQVALGGWVSTNYAVLACTDFPRCQGSFWPPMNFEQGFDLWRGLGRTANDENITFAALTAIHYTHRAFAMVVVILMSALAWQLNHAPGYRQASRWLAGLLTLQVATGLSNIVFEWPLLSALLHTGGAAAMVMVLTRVVCKAWLPNPQNAMDQDVSTAMAPGAHQPHPQTGLHL